MTLARATDHPQTASRRLDDLQHNADLHPPIVQAPPAGNIGQLADACQTDAAAP